MYDEFYKRRHKTEAGRQATLSFLKLEDECDQHNREMFEAMEDKLHVKKQDLNKFLSSTNLNHRDRKSLRKKIKTEPLHSLGRDRIWIKC